VAVLRAEPPPPTPSVVSPSSARAMHVSTTTLRPVRAATTCAGKESRAAKARRRMIKEVLSVEVDGAVAGGARCGAGGRGRRYRHVALARLSPPAWPMKTNIVRTSAIQKRLSLVGGKMVKPCREEGAGVARSASATMFIGGVRARSGRGFRSRKNPRVPRNTFPVTRVNVPCSDENHRCLKRPLSISREALFVPSASLFVARSGPKRGALDVSADPDAPNP